MRQLLVLFFCGLSSIAFAQSAATPATGTNSDANVPVNVAVPALRPAQPAMHQSVPVQNHGQFYIVNDKPVTRSGQPAAPRQRNPISKEELIKQSQGAAPAGNQPSPSNQEKAKKASSQPNGKPAESSGAR